VGVIGGLPLLFRDSGEFVDDGLGRVNPTEYDNR
jgi:hypothetical protein